MADGSIEVGSTEAGTRPAAPAQTRGLGVFLRTRNGILIIVATFVALALALFLALNFSPAWGLHLIRAPLLNSAEAWLWLMAASCGLWLPLLLLLLDPPDNMATGPGLPLPLITLGVLAGLAAISVLMKPFLDSAFAAKRNGSDIAAVISSAPLLAFFAFLSAALIARICNAGLFAHFAMALYRARQEEALRKSAGGDAEAKELIKSVEAYRKEQGNAEALSAIIATAAVMLIGGLALMAGGWNANTHIGTNVGVVVAAVIVGIFAVVFLLEWLAEFPPVRALSRLINGASQSFAFLAVFYNVVDLLLVRIGAQVAGAGHNNPYTRYAVMAGTQLSLAVMTWFLPDPLGLVTAGIGFTLALSVARLWAWVEEDRHLALITQFNANTPRRIGFKEDYRDEAIFGFIFVLALIPMALKQADAGNLFHLSYFTGADHSDPLPWLVYFSLELAKAMPIVGWADIYLQQVKFDTLQPTHPWGQHATFLARVLVDLVLVSSLLQAVNITLRNRQQKALYVARQIKRLDELVERGELRKAVARPKDEWFKRGLDFRYYDQDRLRELHSSTSDLRRRDFIEKIFAQKGEAVGFTIQVLEDLAKRRARGEELQATLNTVVAEHHSNVHKVRPLDFLGVFEHLRSFQGLRDFKIHLLDFVEQVGSIEERETPKEFGDLLEQVIFKPRWDQFIYTRVHAAKALTRIVPRLNDRNDLSTMLANLKADRTDIFGASTYVAARLEDALVMRLKEIGPPSV